MYIYYIYSSVLDRQHFRDPSFYNEHHRIASFANEIFSVSFLIFFRAVLWTVCPCVYLHYLSTVSTRERCFFNSFFDTNTESIWVLKEQFHSELILPESRIHVCHLNWQAIDLLFIFYTQTENIYLRGGGHWFALK